MPIQDIAGVDLLHFRMFGNKTYIDLEISVDVLIWGGIGGGAKTALAFADIELYGGVSGEADDEVNAFLSHALEFNPDVMCGHHEGHHHEGECGEHGCGGRNCGEKD